MRIDDIKGKEVVDDRGNRIGEVEDIDLDLRSRRIGGLVIREGGFTAKLRIGDTRVIPCSMIQTIGDKILLKEEKPLTQEELNTTGRE